MITQKRTTRLTAAPVDDAHHAVEAEAAALEASLVHVAAHTLEPGEQAQRDAAFSDGVRTLRVGGARIVLSERILLVLGGVLAPLGLVVVVLGWWGAAHTSHLFEQLPYLISGGLLGLGLVFLGCFFYFAHWLTQLVKEHRVQSVAMIEAIQRLQDQVARLDDGGPAAFSSNGHHPPTDEPEPLVATGRGSMAHRPACVVVAGKTDLRGVLVTDGLAPCKLCEPY